jgi:hypothetical protein
MQPELLLNDAQDVLLRENEILDIIDLEFGAAVLGENHAVTAGLTFIGMRLPLSSMRPSPTASTVPLHRTLFAGSVWQINATLGLLLTLDRLDDNTVCERPDAEIRAPYLCNLLRYRSGETTEAVSTLGKRVLTALYTTESVCFCQVPF